MKYHVINKRIGEENTLLHTEVNDMEYDYMVALSYLERIMRRATYSRIKE